ncbi:hypothetical protein [Aeromonas sp. R9-1]|uniref:hypothetical protein n=1 Tax=Aeromonas sp. R9-1 TaxID=3138478 RepID=UPI0034A166CE
MNWRHSPLTLPASLIRISTNASSVATAIPSESHAATDRLTAITGRAGYRRHPLSEPASALQALRSELDQLLAHGHHLTVTPFMHRVGQRQGKQWTLSAEQAVSALAAKLRDSADPLRPQGTLYAVAWLVAGNNAAELASALTPLCQLLPLPAWCALLRRLQADNDTMATLAAPATPLWAPKEPLTWDPLRRGRRLVGAQLAQLESLAADALSPIERLAALAQQRSAHLDTLATQLKALASLQGQLWHWHGHGDPATLASSLAQSAPPGAMSMTTGALLLSPSPLTFWQELTP